MLLSMEQIHLHLLNNVLIHMHHLYLQGMYVIMQRHHQLKHHVLLLEYEYDQLRVDLLLNENFVNHILYDRYQDNRDLLIANQNLMW
jgi:hypothetical protein